MTHKETIEKLIEIIQHNVDHAKKVISAVTGESLEHFIDCEFMERTFKTNQWIIEIVAQSLPFEEAEGWLEWYIYETNYGEITNTVILNPEKDDEKEVIVDSVEKLIYVMSYKSLGD
jgi:hypothetical protein